MCDAYKLAIIAEVKTGSNVAVKWGKVQATGLIATFLQPPSVWKGVQHS